MKKNLKKVILPVSLTSIAALPLLATISANGESDSNTSQSYNGEGFTGTYIKDASMSITKNFGESTSIFGNININTPSQNLEWNWKTSSWDVWQNENAYSSSISEGWKHLANPNYSNSVIVEEIASNQMPENNFYFSSTNRRRKWRAVFNNGFIPTNPQNTETPNEGSNYVPNSYGNLSFGLALTRDLQIADNSVRISIIPKNSSYNWISLPDDPQKNGYVYNVLNNTNSTPLTTGPVFVPDFRNKHNLVRFDLGSFSQGNIYINSDNAFYNPFNDAFNGAKGEWKDNSWLYNTPFKLNNIMYRTVDQNYGDNIGIVSNLINGDKTQSGYPSAQWQTLLASFLIKEPNSPLVNNINNAGSVLFGQVSTGAWNNRSSNYRPTVVVEFETIDNQSDYNINNQINYPFTKTNNGGVSAFLTLYGGVGYNYVAANSVSYNRTSYRTINVKVVEHAISSYLGIKQGVNNYFIPGGYGYDLYYGNTKIGSIPADVIDRAKTAGYAPDRKDFTLNLRFNSDTSQWPEEMKNSYNGFMDPNKLILKKNYKNPDQEAFFSVGKSHDFDQRPEDNGEYSIGGTYLDSNSLKYNNEIVFYNYPQWTGSPTNQWGIIKLNELKSVANATSNSNSAGNYSIYKGKNYSFENTALLDNQIKAIDNSLYSDWRVSHFTNKLWVTLEDDIKQGLFDVRQNSVAYKYMGDIKQYNETPNATNNQTVQNVKNYLQIQNWKQNKDQKMDNYVSYSFATPELKAKFDQAYTNLENWESKNWTPNINISGETLVDTNNVATNLKNLSENLINTLNALKTAKGIGFENGEQLTAQEFVNKAFELIDSTNIYSPEYISAFKNFVLQQTSRETVVEYVNALLAINEEYKKAEPIYNKYNPVLTDQKYVNLQVPSNPTYSAFQNKMTAFASWVEKVKSLKEKQLVDPNMTTLSFLKDAAEGLKPNNLDAAYQAITSDVDTFVSKVKAMKSLSQEDINSYEAQLNAVIASQGSQINSNRLLENFEAREIALVKIFTTAEMQNKVNEIKNKKTVATDHFLDINSTTLSTSYNKNFTSSAGTYPINLTNTESVSFPISQNFHEPNSSYLTNENNSNAIYYMYPNTTLDSAAINYIWQAANYKNGSNLPSSSITVQKVDTNKASDILANVLELYKQSLNSKNSWTSYTEINNLYTQKASNLDNFLLSYASLVPYKGTNGQNGGLNTAQYNEFVKQLYEFTIVNPASDLESKVSSWTSNVQSTVAAMNSLKTILNTYYLPSTNNNTSSTNVFLNGQFYGFGNYDHSISKGNSGEFNVQMPVLNGELIALLTTTLQVLQTPYNTLAFNKFVASNAAESEIIAGMKSSNIPAVLSVTLDPNATEYKTFVYTPEMLKTLADSLKDGAAQLSGRKDAVSNQYAPYLANLFGEINKTNGNATPLFSAEELTTFKEQISKLNWNSYTIENDNSYYYQINQLLVAQATKYINSLQNVSQADKTSAINAIALQQNSVTFADLMINATNQPQWLWKLQAILYQVSQIDNENAKLKANISQYTSLNASQVEALKNQYLNGKLWNSDSVNITTKGQKLDNKFSKVNKVLYLQPNGSIAQNAAALNKQMKTLKDFMSNQIAALNVEKENQDPILTYATNKDEFMSAYKAVGDVNAISNINASQVKTLYENLKTQYDALNGYNNKLQKEINATDSNIQNFITQPEFSKIANIASLPKITTQEEYQAEYNKLLNSLKDQTTAQINKQQYLTQAQKNDLNKKAAAVNGSFNNLLPIVNNATALNTQMQKLQSANSAATSYLNDNKSAIDSLPDSPEKAELKNALEQAKVVLGTYSEQNAQAQNLTAEQAKELTDKINDSLAKVKKDLIIQSIKKTLEPVNTSSPSGLQQAKNSILSQATNTASDEALKALEQKAKNAITLTPLYQEIDNTNKINHKTPELNNAIQAAEKYVNDTLSSTSTPDASVVQQEVTKLQNAAKLNELQGLIHKAQGIDTPSNALKEAINSATTVAKANNTAQYQAQINNLKDAILKEPLNSAIQTATEANEKLKDPELKNAIENAKAVLAKPNLTQDQIEQAAKELNNALKMAKIRANAQGALSDKIKEAEAVKPAVSQYLQSIIDKAKQVQNSASSTSKDFLNAINQLDAAMSLNKLIQAQKAAQDKVKESGASSQFTTVSDEISKYIEKEEAIINNPTQASDIDGSKLNNEVNNFVNKIYQAANANSVLKKIDEENAALSNENPASDLVPYLNNYKANAAKLAQQALNATDGTTLGATPEETSALSKIQSLAEANYNYYKLNKLIDSANQITDKSESLQNALSDASVIKQLGGAGLPFESQNSLNNVFNSTVPSLKQDNLKDKTNNATGLIDQAYKNLESAQSKNTLANTIAKAKKELEIINATNTGATLDPEDKLLQDKYEALNQAITTAEGVLGQNNLVGSAYNAEAEKLEAVITAATGLMNELKGKLQSTIDAATAFNSNPEIAAQITKATGMIKDPNAKGVDVVEETNTLNKLVAKAKLQQALDNVDPEIQNSKAYQDILKTPATTVLNDPNSTVDQYNKETEKINAVAKAKKLLQAIDAVNSTAVAPLSDALSQALAQAKSDITNNLTTQDQNYFDNKAKELLNALNDNNLDNLINQADKITPASEALSKALNNAKGVKANVQSTPEEKAAAVKALAQTINQNSLVNAINDAQNVVKSFTPEAGQNDTEQAAKIRESLTNALKDATAVLNNPASSKEQLDNAANTLTQALVQPKETLNKAKSDLQKLVDETTAKIQNHTLEPSNELNKDLAAAKEALSNPKSNYFNYTQANKDLANAVKANDLQKAIESAKTYPDSFPQEANQILNNSKAMAQNASDQTSEALANQAKLQTLANNVVDKMLEVNKLDSLNNAQKTAIIKSLSDILAKPNIAADSTANNQIDSIVTNAKDLNAKMQELSQYVNELPESLRNNPLSSINYTYADSEKQVAYNTALENATSVLNKETGKVVDNNQASAITNYLNALKDAKDALNGHNNFKALKDAAAEQLTKDATVVNTNSFFNAPTALQNKYNNALAQAQADMKVVDQMTSATNKDNTDKLQSDLDNLKALQDEINKFSNKSYEINGAKVPGVDKVLEGLNNLSPAYKQQIKDSYNNATTYPVASQILKEAKAKNDSITNDINNLTDTVKNAIAQAPNVSSKTMDQIKKQLEDVNKIAANPNTVADVNKLVNGLDNLLNFNNALNQYKASSISNADYNTVLNNLEKFINAAEIDQSTIHANNADAMQTLANKLANEKTVATNMINAVKALQNGDANALATALNNLSSATNNSVYNDLESQVETSNYFNILTTPKKSITKAQVQALKDLIQSTPFLDVDNVIRSAFVQNIKAARSAFPWWAYLIIVSALTWTAGIILLTFRRK
ncbi:hypothetical protein [Mycoplasma sp. 2634B]|uniref:hypothetical protein n=1 Tax=Mycoplasma sp. 2634B TaxID=3401692 RepID=UPI003AB0F8CD